MELTKAQENVIRMQFDCFCKMVLRDEARDYMRCVRRRAAHEILFSEVLETQQEELQSLDEYPSQVSHFYVLGIPISIRDDRLADAIAALATEKRMIILLYYFLEMTDKEIAELLGSVRSSIQYKRNRSLEDIRKRMEG